MRQVLSVRPLSNQQRVLAATWWEGLGPAGGGGLVRKHEGQERQHLMFPQRRIRSSLPPHLWAARENNASVRCCGLDHFYKERHSTKDRFNYRNNNFGNFFNKMNCCCSFMISRGPAEMKEMKGQLVCTLSPLTAQQREHILQICRLILISNGQ